MVEKKGGKKRKKVELNCFYFEKEASCPNLVKKNACGGPARRREEPKRTDDLGKRVEEITTCGLELASYGSRRATQPRLLGNRMGNPIIDALTNDKDEKSEGADSFVEVVEGW
jgi:hypothetical protein